MFKEDLKKGKTKEDEIADYYRDIGLEAIQSKGVDKEKDLIIKGLIEIKYDVKVKETGNIAIEFRYKGKLSGICATKSDAWVIATDDGAWVCPKKKLLELCRERYYYDSEWHFIKGGDNNNSDICLLNYNSLKQFKKIL